MLSFTPCGSPHGPVRLEVGSSEAAYLYTHTTQVRRRVRFTQLSTSAEAGEETRGAQRFAASLDMGADAPPPGGSCAARAGPRGTASAAASTSACPADRAFLRHVCAGVSWSAAVLLLGAASQARIATARDVWAGAGAIGAWGTSSAGSKLVSKVTAMVIAASQSRATRMKSALLTRCRDLQR